MPAVKVRCSNPTCGKGYLLKDESLSAEKVCRKCGSPLARLEDEGRVERPPSQSAIATVAPRGDTSEVSVRDDVTLGREPDAGLPAQSERLPERLGRFEIRAKLGSGAFGIVYRAFDPLLSREVAIKVPHSAVLEKSAAVARFLREPKAAAQLRHPHIVPVYDAGVEGGKYYIASAFIEGITLEAGSQLKPLDFRGAVSVVINLAEALDYAHGLGVVHRDIKPANIMLDARGDALLMDFGLARFEAAEEITHDGALLGTPAYMAPEQAARDQESVGPHSDQYSLGVVLYELLCGRRPFSGPAATVIYNAIHESPPAPRTIRAEIPSDLETIVLKTLAKQPAERYASCQELAADLRRWLDDQPIKARKQSGWERARRMARRNPVLAALGALVAAMAFVSTLAAAGLLISKGQLARAVENERALVLHAEEQSKLARQETANAQAKKKLAELRSWQANEKRISAEASEQQAKVKEDEARDALVKAEAEAELRRKSDEEAAVALAKAEKLLAALAASQEAKRLAEEELAREQRNRDRVSPRAAWNTYCRSLSAAHDAWKRRDFAGALSALEECDPTLRGWEWTMLEELCHRSAWRQTVRTLPGQIHQFNRDGTIVSVRGSGAGKPPLELYRMPESTPIKAEFESPQPADGFSWDGSVLLNAGRFIDLRTGRKTNPVPNNFDNLGFSPDGFLLLRRTTGLLGMAPRADLSVTKGFFTGLEVERVFFSADGRYDFIISSKTGPRKERLRGLFYGPAGGELKFVELPLPDVSGGGFGSKRLPATYRIVAQQGLAVVPLAESRFALLDYTSGEVSIKSLAFIEPLSISPDKKRVLIVKDADRREPRKRQFLLADLETGDVLPELSVFPWSGAGWNCVADETWTSFTLLRDNTWERWNCAAK